MLDEIEKQINSLKECIEFEKTFPKPDKYVLEELEKEIKKLEKYL